MAVPAASVAAGTVTIGMMGYTVQRLQSGITGTIAANSQTCAYSYMADRMVDARRQVSDDCAELLVAVANVTKVTQPAEGNFLRNDRGLPKTNICQWHQPAPTAAPVVELHSVRHCYSYHLGRCVCHISPSALSLSYLLQTHRDTGTRPQ